MNPREQLAKILEATGEDECLEFKQAATTYDFEKLGRYFSALSNEANLRGLACAWLVMGVDDNRNILGTQFKPHHASLQKLKRDIAPHTALNFTFDNIFAIRHPAQNKRILMFQIPAAPAGVPMSWRGHHYGRDHESTVALKQNEYDAIRAQAAQDWSGTLSATATITSDLDPGAIAKAREGFKTRNPTMATECDGWVDETFLSKAKLLRGGKLTFAALLLLGRPESAHLLSPASAAIFWVRKRPDQTNADFFNFAPPYVIAVDELFARVRNDRFQFLREGSLFPVDLLQYDPWVIREMLHNAIAHQDYRQNRRINVIEREGTLDFSNAGTFEPGSVEDVVERDRPQDHFRNLCLVEAMRSINMIETLGSGIPRVYRLQRKRGFPMTDYDLSDSRTVAVTVYGRVLDENYTRTLLANPDIEIRDVIALDKVQKGVKLAASDFSRLRAKGLVDGIRTKAWVAAHVSDDGGVESVAKQIVIYLKSGVGKSSLILEFVAPHLPASLTKKQKVDKIRNTLQRLAREGRVENVGGGGRGAVWKLLG